MNEQEVTSDPTLSNYVGDVKSAVASTTAECCLSDSSGLTWDITGIFSSENHVQNEQQVTGPPTYIIYACNFDNLRCVSTPCGLVEISIPGWVRELPDCCFKGCKGLRRVTFVPSSSLERIGVSCFERQRALSASLKML